VAGRRAPSRGTRPISQRLAFQGAAAYGYRRHRPAIRAAAFLAATNAGNWEHYNPITGAGQGEPDIEVAVRAGRVGAGVLEQRVLVAGVVQHDVDDHPDAAPVRLVEEHPEVVERADRRIDVGVVGDVVAAVAQR